MYKQCQLVVPCRHDSRYMQEGTAEWENKRMERKDGKEARERGFPPEYIFGDVKSYILICS